MDWRRAPTGKPVRYPTFIEAVIQTCLTLKELFRLPLGQVIGLVESQLRLASVHGLGARQIYRATPATIPATSDRSTSDCTAPIFFASAGMP